MLEKVPAIVGEALQGVRPGLEKTIAHGAHSDVFQIFALGEGLGLGGEPGRGAVLDALRGKVLAKGVLVGTDERP